MIDIITIVVCGVISGAEGWNDIALFARCKKQWLQSILELPGGIPSHDTIERVFRRMNPLEFQHCFLEWVREIDTVTRGEIVAIDGKTLRGSKDGGNSAIHLVSAWANANGMVLGQIKTNQKSNEITAIPELLKLLEVKGCIITIDAMGCQKEIAKRIIGKEADYVLALKENQSNLYQEVKLFFEDCLKNGFQDVEYDFYQNKDKGHGRIEIRKYWITSQVDWLSQKGSWEKLTSIGMVESQRIIGEEKSLERRYYISSLEGKAIQFARAVRGHWGIENRLHWTLDVLFREDDIRIRRDYGPENMAVIRHVALNLMKRDTRDPRLTMRNKKKLAEWDLEYVKDLIFGNLSGDDLK